MFSRFFSSRATKKFMRNKSALFATTVILCYLAAGLAVAVGFITLKDTEEKIEFAHIPGFGFALDDESRILRSEYLIKQLRKNLNSSDPTESLQSWNLMAGWTFAKFTPEELAVAAEQAMELVEEVASEYEELADLRYEPTLVEEIAASEELVKKQLLTLEAEVVKLIIPPSGFWHQFKIFCGTDRQGRSILLRAIYSINVALMIGVVTSLLSVIFGSLLGAAAAFFGGIVDLIVIWLYSTLSSVPNLVLLSVLAFMFAGSDATLPFTNTSIGETLVPVYIAFCMTFWIGPCRVIRGETLKIKELEYVQAATAIGFGRMRILIKQVIPNTSHLMFVNFSLLFVGAIKSEVILSFLGLGVKNGPSWGIMISQSKSEVLNNIFWQIGTATFFMFVLVLAFNIFTDALQDALDPKHTG